MYKAQFLLQWNGQASLIDEKIGDSYRIKGFQNFPRVHGQTWSSETAEDQLDPPRQARASAQSKRKLKRKRKGERRTLTGTYTLVKHEKVPSFRGDTQNHDRSE